MYQFSPEESHVPIIRPREVLNIVILDGEVRRKIFSVLYTKRGDVMMLTPVAGTRLRRGIASIDADSNLRFDVDPEDIGTAADMELRKYFTFHSSVDGNERMATPVINGVGGIQEIGVDLRTTHRTEQFMVHRMTTPSRYPETSGGDNCLEVGNIFRDGLSPEFHIFVTPIKGKTPVDHPVKFIPSLSANFVTEPFGVSKRHMLFQIRVGYIPGEFPPEHQILVPRKSTASGLPNPA